MSGALLWTGSTMLTELVRLVSPVDNLLERKGTSVRPGCVASPFSRWNTHLPRLFEIYRQNHVSVLPNSWGSHETTSLGHIRLADLANRQPDRSKQSQRSSDGLVSRHLHLISHASMTMLIYTQSSRSTSGPRFICAVTVWNINRLSLREGIGNSIFRSRRPGRRRAGSRVSCRFVAMMT